MQREDRVDELMQEAEKLGVTFVFDAGLVIARRSPGDVEKQELAVAKLSRYIPDLRLRVQRRASGVRAKDLAGARIWSAEGAGTLLGGGAGGDGELRVRISADMRRVDQNETSRTQMTVTNTAENLLIVVDDEGTAGAAGPTVPTPEPKPGFFDRLRRG